MRMLFSLSLIALCALPALAATNVIPGYGAIDAPRDTDPLTLAQSFCAARIADDMAPLATHFAPKLAKVLEGAKEVPWQSYPDHPVSCSIKVLNGYDDTIGVLIEVTYDAGTRKWSDTLNFERTTTSWLLNNVFYEGGGNLRFRLFSGS